MRAGAASKKVSRRWATVSSTAAGDASCAASCRKWSPRDMTTRVQRGARGCTKKLKANIARSQRETEHQEKMGRGGKGGPRTRRTSRLRHQGAKQQGRPECGASPRERGQEGGSQSGTAERARTETHAPKRQERQGAKGHRNGSTRANLPRAPLPDLQRDARV